MENVTKRIRLSEERRIINIFGEILFIKIGRLAKSIRAEIQNVKVIRGAERKSVEKPLQKIMKDELKGKNFIIDIADINISVIVIINQREEDLQIGSKSNDKEVSESANIFLLLID